MHTRSVRVFRVLKLQDTILKKKDMWASCWGVRLHTTEAAEATCPV